MLSGKIDRLIGSDLKKQQNLSLCGRKEKYNCVLVWKYRFYHFHDCFEVDFLAQDLSGKMKLFQACYQADDPRTLAREERALNQAREELNVEGTIVTPENFLGFARDPMGEAGGSVFNTSL